MNTRDENVAKIIIAVKDIFDASPISRSQAKSVCTRMMGFQEVIIDFEDVEWMGQAFAHQLFVVFACKHRNIGLTPVNMNENVNKMYNHVMLGAEMSLQ